MDNKDEAQGLELFDVNMGEDEEGPFLIIAGSMSSLSRQVAFALIGQPLENVLGKAALGDCKFAPLEGILSIGPEKMPGKWALIIRKSPLSEVAGIFGEERMKELREWLNSKMED